MKEFSIDEKAKRYDEAYKKAAVRFGSNVADEIFLKESEDEKTKKEIINYLECQSRDEPSRKDTRNKWISYIEKHALSKDDYDFLRNCARVLKSFGYQSSADRLTGLCPALGEEAKAMMATPIIFDESEDERIRKELLNHLKEASYGKTLVVSTLDYKIWADWFEKQGEQKPANKVEPKFKIGDWVVRNGETLQISGIDTVLDGTFHYWFTKGTWLSSKKMENATLWTIQDAKDGDVLSYNDGHGNDCIELIKSITDKKIEFWFCLTNGNRYEVFDGITPYTNLASREDATPATKEQHNLLFQKMHEAGYEWDAEKKELKKLGEKTDAWSEEDEKIAKTIINEFEQSSEWYCANGLTKEDCIAWLNRQMHTKWSEENKNKVNNLYVLLDQMVSFNMLSNKDATEFKDWLKSLRPQNTWKPSEEQMNLLEELVEDNNQRHFYTILRSLYEQLKKLMEK